MTNDTIDAVVPAEPTHVPARTPEETEKLLGQKPKDDGSIPRTSVTVTIAEKEYVFGDLSDRIARETITPIMAIQTMQQGGVGGLIESVNLIADFLGRFHEATWNSNKNRASYNQGEMYADREQLNNAQPFELMKAFNEISEMLIDPFVRMGLLTHDPEAQEKIDRLAKLTLTSS